MRLGEIVVPRPAIVIVMREVLVARDIEMIIGDLRPDARVFVARSLVEAEDMVRHETVHAALVQAKADDIASSELGRHVLAAGGNIVVMGTDKHQRFDALGWSALPFPFTHEDLAALLRQLSLGGIIPGV